MKNVEFPCLDYSKNLEVCIKWIENSKFGNFEMRPNFTFQDLSQMHKTLDRMFQLLQNGASVKCEDT